MVIKQSTITKASCIIIDIKRYDFVAQKSEHFGWAVYPLASEFQQRLYINSGVMQLALYQGKVPKQLVALIKNDTTVTVNERIT